MVQNWDIWSSSPHCRLGNDGSAIVIGDSGAFFSNKEGGQSSFFFANVCFHVCASPHTCHQPWRWNRSNSSLTSLPSLIYNNDIEYDAIDMELLVIIVEGNQRGPPRLERVAEKSMTKVHFTNGTLNSDRHHYSPPPAHSLFIKAHAPRWSWPKRHHQPIPPSTPLALFHGQLLLKNSKVAI